MDRVILESRALEWSDVWNGDEVQHRLSDMYKLGERIGRIGS